MGTRIDPALRDDPERGFLMKSIPVDGTDRAYLLYVPAAYDPSTPSPALVFLNGKGECGTDGLLPLAAGLGPAIIRNPSRWPFLVLFPQKRDPEILWGDDEAVVMAALEQTRREYNVDAARTGLTGISQGGNGTWTIAARHPGLFASLVAICGWTDETTARQVAAIPSWIFHGEADAVVPASASRDMDAWIRGAGGNCRLTVYPGVDHKAWDRAYAEPELPAWMAAQRKPA
jgi:predicted peptidase